MARLIFLPTTPEEMVERGWRSLDVILITGDAYVDHPSFGVALIGRWLEAHGYRVGVIAQPLSVHDVSRLGRPNLFFGVTSGNVDSMVANYTALRKKRKSDDYTPGGVNNRRPDRALIQYANLIRQAFKNVVIVVGGLEASLRRFSHYDWWSNKVRKSILLDSKADVLVYGMGERAILEIAKRLEAGKSLEGIRGTMVWKNGLEPSEFRDLAVHELPTHEEVSHDRVKYAKMYRELSLLTDPFKNVVVVQKQDNRYVVQYPPALPLSTEELDGLYLLPFARAVHPFYESVGSVRAIETVRFSITAVRGCVGNCAFCALAHHQSTHVSFRSADSIVEEAKIITKLPGFSGTIVDVGGPTANLWGSSCPVRTHKGQCDRNCLVPVPCRNTISDGGLSFIELLRKIKSLPRVKHVFVSSGIRHDIILSSRYADEVIEGLIEFTPGQLKLAPEHSHPKVLQLMRKPPVELFLEFKRRFEAAAQKKGTRKFVVGYFLVGHPGEGEAENLHLVRFVSRELGYTPQQVQIFTPAPGTLATTMYYTGIDPFTGDEVDVVREDKLRRLFKERVVRPWLSEPIGNVESTRYRTRPADRSTGSRSERCRYNDEMFDSFE